MSISQQYLHAESTFFSDSERASRQVNALGPTSSPASTGQAVQPLIDAGQSFIANLKAIHRQSQSSADAQTLIVALAGEVRVLRSFSGGGRSLNLQSTCQRPLLRYPNLSKRSGTTLDCLPLRPSKNRPTLPG